EAEPEKHRRDKEQRRLQLGFQALPVWTIVTIAAAVGLLVGLLRYYAFEGVSPRWVSLGGSINLLDMDRAVYVVFFVVLVASLTQTQSIRKWVGLLVAFYALETISGALDTMATGPILTTLYQALEMLLEWLFVAVLFFSLKDRIMMGIAGVIGMAYGVILSVLQVTYGNAPAEVLNRAEVFNLVVNYSTTAFCIAYGIRRQTQRAT